MKNLILIITFLFTIIVIYGQNSYEISKKRDEIFSYIKKEQVEKIKEYLNQGGEANLVNKKGESLLMVACDTYFPNTAIIRILLQHGADVLYQKEKFGDSPLSLSTDHLNYEVSKVLFNNLTENEKQNIDGLYYLKTCIYNSDFLSFKMIFPYVNKEVFYMPVLNKYLLEHAIEVFYFNEEIFSLPPYENIKKDRIDPNASYEIIHFMKANGVRFDINNKYGIPIVFKAVRSSKVFKLFIKDEKTKMAVDTFHGVNYTLLHAFMDEFAKPIAIINGKHTHLDSPNEIDERIVLIALMIQKGVKLENRYTDPYEYLLFQLVENNHILGLKRLLEKHKLNLNILNLEKESLLQKAIDLNFLEIQEILIEHGAQS